MADDTDDLDIGHLSSGMSIAEVERLRKIEQLAWQTVNSLAAVPNPPVEPDGKLSEQGAYLGIARRAAEDLRGALRARGALAAIPPDSSAAKRIGIMSVPERNPNLPDHASAGPWLLGCHIETAVLPRPAREVPPAGPGDVSYRIVFDIQYDTSVESQDDLAGLAGELTTCWQYSLEDAVRQACFLKHLFVGWREYREATNEYIEVYDHLRADRLIDEAVKRFRITKGEFSCTKHGDVEFMPPDKNGNVYCSMCFDEALKSDHISRFSK